jgi:hypothetical protein
MAPRITTTEYDVDERLVNSFLEGMIVMLTVEPDDADGYVLDEMVVLGTGDSTTPHGFMTLRVAEWDSDQLRRIDGTERDIPWDDIEEISVY